MWVRIIAADGTSGPEATLADEVLWAGGFGAIQALSSVAVVFDGVDYQAFWIERVESGAWVVAARSIDEDGRLGPRYAVMAPEIDAARPRLFARVAGPGRVMVAVPTVDGGVAVDWIADGATEGGYRVLTTIDSDCDPADRVLGAEIQPGPAGPQLHVLFCGSSTVPAFPANTVVDNFVVPHGGRFEVVREAATA